MTQPPQIDGSGQPKRNDYKIRRVVAMVLSLIDIATLLNEMVLLVYDRKVGLLYDRNVEKNTVDLLTKRYIPKVNYCPLALDHRKVLTRSVTIGNTNKQLKNEAWRIIDKLLYLGSITKEQHDAYVNKYLLHYQLCVKMIDH